MAEQVVADNVGLGGYGGGQFVEQVAADAALRPTGSRVFHTPAVNRMHVFREFAADFDKIVFLQAVNRITVGFFAVLPLADFRFAQRQLRHQHRNIEEFDGKFGFRRMFDIFGRLAAAGGQGGKQQNRQVFLHGAFLSGIWVRISSRVIIKKRQAV